MNRPLWVQKLSDERLKEMLSYVQDIEILGSTDNEKVLNITETWYDQKVGIERLMAFSIDVWKEAALRWVTTVNGR